MLVCLLSLVSFLKVWKTFKQLWKLSFLKAKYKIYSAILSENINVFLHIFNYIYDVIWQKILIKSAFCLQEYNFPETFFRLREDGLFLSQPLMKWQSTSCVFLHFPSYFLVSFCPTSLCFHSRVSSRLQVSPPRLQLAYLNAFKHRSLHRCFYVFVFWGPHSNFTCLPLSKCHII